MLEEVIMLEEGEEEAGYVGSHGVKKKIYIYIYVIFFQV